MLWRSYYRAVCFDVQSAAVIKKEAQVVDLEVKENLAGEYLRFFRKRYSGKILDNIDREGIHR